MAAWKKPKRGMWARLTEAARNTNSQDDRPSRSRRVTEFMAYSFLLSYEIDKVSGLFSAARASTLDGVDIDSAGLRADASRGGSFEAPSFDDGRGDEPVASGSAQLLNGLERVSSISAEGNFHSPGTALHVHAKLVSAPINVTLNVTQSLKLDSGSPVAPLPTPSPVIGQIATLPGFQGLTTFMEGQGLGKASTVFDTDGMGAAKGPVSAALDFAETPMTTLGYWAATGHLAPTSVPLTTDGLSVEWMVQANGQAGANAVSINESRGFDAGEIDNAVLSSGAATQSNTASVVDGQDWEGLLVVKGNYYEFNTIIQINAIWDRDTVRLESGVAPPAADAQGAPVIDTGSNQQTNAARILDPVVVPDVGPDTSEMDALLSEVTAANVIPHQVVVGGQEEHFSVLQINSLVDIDTIDFSASDALAQMGLSSDLGVFADVKSAGGKQANDSYIDSTAADPFGLGRLKDMVNQVGSSMTKMINGHYYEFNTVIQVNVLYDDDLITGSGGSTAGKGSGIASGGNLQFNTATIQKADNFDYLFVNGKYSEFNLVLQLNVLNDSDKIFQKLGLPGMPDLPGAIDIHHSGSDGESGDGGLAAAMSVPSAFGDLGLRSSDVWS